MVKNDQVFHRVSRVSRSDASMTSKLTRVGVHGEPWENIHHRRGSAPRVERISHGSMTFPTLLDIFRPSASTMCPRQSTLR